VIGTANLILIAAAFLGLAIAAAALVARLQPESLAEVDPDDPEAPPVVPEEEVIGGSAWEGFRAVVRSRYLTGIATFVLVMAIMATFIYFTRLQMVAAMTEVEDQRTGLFGQIDFYTQVTTLVIQLLVTGHIMKRFGVAVALVLLPLTVALGFVGLAISGTFAAMIILEALYRAVQRGITRPARETLFTVVSREDKYKSKAVIDTFVYRTGDVAGAWTEGLLGRIGAGLVGLTALVVPLAAAWGLLAIWLGREQSRMAKRQAGGGPDQRSGAGPAPGVTPTPGP
jgi:ATP:ADP antiporter, AAA family